MPDIELQPFSKSDFKELISWVRNPDELFIWSATTYVFPLDEKQLEKHYEESRNSNPRIMYTVVDSQSKEHIGHIELVRVDREQKKTSIAYVLIDPAKRGLGYGDALMRGILNECFHRMQMSRVDLFVFEFNPVAIHCYQKAGFEIEEIIADRIKSGENFVTLYLMGISHEKWMAANSRSLNL